MKRSFKGVWIPKEIWLARKLSLQEKVFIAEIDSLDDEIKGCYAGNNHFMELFDLSESRVSAIIKALSDKGLIDRKITNTQTGRIRVLRISHLLKTRFAQSFSEEVRNSQKQDLAIAKNNNIDNNIEKTFSFIEKNQNRRIAKQKLNPRKL